MRYGSSYTEIRTLPTPAPHVPHMSRHAFLEPAIFQAVYPIWRDTVTSGHSVPYWALLPSRELSSDPDAELDAPFPGNLDIPLRHCPLHLDWAADRVDDAGKLDEQPVGGCLDDGPRSSLTLASLSSRRIALNAASLPSSSSPISRREQPATSAPNIAARRRSTRSRLPVVIDAILAQPPALAQRAGACSSPIPLTVRLIKGELSQ